MTETPSKPYRTTNLNLATYLILQGLEYELVFDRVTKSNAPIGAWVFAPNDSTDKYVKDYNDGEALVEPKAYSRVLVTTRKEVIRFAEEADGPSH